MSCISNLLRLASEVDRLSKRATGNKVDKIIEKHDLKEDDIKDLAHFLVDIGNPPPKALDEKALEKYWKDWWDGAVPSYWDIPGSDLRSLVSEAYSATKPSFGKTKKASGFGFLALISQASKNAYQQSSDAEKKYKKEREERAKSRDSNRAPIKPVTYPIHMWSYDQGKFLNSDEESYEKYVQKRVDIEYDNYTWASKQVGLKVMPKSTWDARSKSGKYLPKDRANVINHVKDDVQSGKIDMKEQLEGAYGDNGKRRTFKEFLAEQVQDREAARAGKDYKDITDAETVDTKAPTKKEPTKEAPKKEESKPTTEEPSYKNYVDRKKQEGEQPSLSKDEWEARFALIGRLASSYVHAKVAIMPPRTLHGRTIDGFIESLEDYRRRDGDLFYKLYDDASERDLILVNQLCQALKSRNQAKAKQYADALGKSRSSAKNIVHDNVLISYVLDGRESI